VDLHLWQPTPDNIRLLNALLDRRSSIANDLKREQNRLEKVNSTLIIVPILKSIKTNIKSLTRQIQNLDTQIQNHIDQDHELKRDQKLLESIPAIAERTSLLMLVFLRAHSF
ncbi:IS110 family transposase, partial [Acinetobacter guillouiae]|nr:IS110 family transposase [Acinetobacter guillouiae]